jgi:hypothetical protein
LKTVTKRQLFETVVYELFHALGISGEALSLWLDPVTHESYGPDVPEYILESENGKEYMILHTPYLHQVIAERFGYEFFDEEGQLPVGVELENNGGSGTAGFHWESRTSFTELMIGTTYGYEWIS